MKNYNEVAKDVLRRRDEHNETVAKRSRMIAQIGVPTVSLCLAAIIGIGMWQAGDLGDPPKKTEDAVIPGIPDVTGPGDETNAVHEDNTELVEDVNPGIPDGDTQESGEKTESGKPTTAPAVNRVPEVGETTGEVAIEPHWGEKLLYSKYPEFELGGTTYITAETWIEKDKLGDSLGTATAYGYDIYNDKAYEMGITVYAVNGIDSAAAVAVAYDGFPGKYAVYTNSWYKPETLGGFVDALNLKESLSFSGSIYRTVEEYGSYMTVEYESPDLAQAVWEMLLDDATLVNCIDEMPTFYHSVISISSNVDVLGINNKSIALTEDGYLWTNILDTAKAFYIGEEKVQKFVSYVEETCARVTEQVPETTSGDKGKAEVSEPAFPDYVVEMTTATHNIIHEDTAYEEDIPEEELIAEPYIPDDIEEVMTIPAYDPSDTADVWKIAIPD